MNTNKSTNILTDLTAFSSTFCCGEVKAICPTCGSEVCLFCEMECC